MAKRVSDEVKSWWELDFDEGSYKFRKLNRHHQEQEQWPDHPHALQEQIPHDGLGQADPIPLQQDAQAADEDMPDAN